MAMSASIGKNLKPFTGKGDVSICIEWKILQWDQKPQTKN